MKLYTGQRWALIGGDCRERVSRFAEHRFDAVVTDPPYELGFMGKAWDSSGVAFQAETWAAMLRVLKPGAHLVAFGGSRTFHRIAVAIEDAGFEVRDTLCWLYGTGFPKSLNVGKALDAAAGVERVVTRRARVQDNARPDHIDMDPRSSVDRERRDLPATDAARQWEGWGTALKPGWEPIILARKPLDGTVAENVQRWGTGALNVDGCRIETTENLNGGAYASQGTTRDDGWGMERGGAGKYVQPAGRWPPNVCLDEEAAALLDAQSGIGTSRKGKPRVSSAPGNGWGMTKTGAEYDDSGGASRFFYCPKASRAERDAGCESLRERSGGEILGREEGSAGMSSPRAGAGRSGRRNHHPTVKPIALMRWLVRLVTPPGGAVLDPFSGSGSTGVAVLEEGFSFCGVEQDAEYLEIARCRLERAARERGAA